MMRTFAVAAFAAAVVGVNAQTFTVVPGDRAAAAGTSTFLGPLSNAARTYQWLIHQNQLSGMVGQFITGFAMRLPTSATLPWPDSDTTYNNFDVYLSAGVDPAARSLTFANNIAGPQTQVRSGPLVITTNSYLAVGTPREWGPEISFSPWLYTGGHIVMELRHDGSNGASRSVDAIGTAVAPYGTEVSAAWTGSYTGTSGSQGNFVITRLTSQPVPEPASLAVLGLGILALRRRKR